MLDHIIYHIVSYRIIMLLHEPVYDLCCFFLEQYNCYVDDCSVVLIQMYSLALNLCILILSMM